MNPSKNDGAWIREELERADFSDARLNDRFQYLSQELAENPSLPINQASTDWAAAKAAYRFFGNEKVKPEKILAPHIQSSLLRIQKHKRIFALQDSTALDFSKHLQTLELGHIGQSNSHEYQGLWMHSTLAITENGLPLGLLDNQIWARDTHEINKGHHMTKIPREKRESFKWFKGLRSVEGIDKNTEVVMVCDREADIYELFEQAQDLGVSMVVRMQHDRITYDDELDYLKVTDHLGLKKYYAKTVHLEVPGSGRRKARTAELSVRYAKINLAAHPRGIRTARVTERRDIELNVVELHELNPPKKQEKLKWYLLTSLDITNFGDCLEVMRIYKLRWQIEQFFKCLKTGCKVEFCRLNTGTKLMNYVSLMSVVAWRILWMTHIKRSDPDLSCELFLTKNEWKALWCQRYKRQIKSGKLKPHPPDKPPSVGEAVKWIAMQGGFLGRKGDGEPGLISIWRGWLRLEVAAEIYGLVTK